MFIGHFALAFGAKKITPRVSLGMLFLAAQLADVIWPALVLLGVERVVVRPGATAFTPLDFVYYPYSHSLVALAGWSIAFAGMYVLTRHARLPVGLTIALLVLSHWVLDVLTHRPDMPLTIHGAERVGLGLWRSVPATLVVELSLLAVGAGVYLRATRPADRIGQHGVWALAVFLVLVYAANLIGPPPPSTLAVAWAGQAMWLLVLWAYWVDQHRIPFQA